MEGAGTTTKKVLSYEMVYASPECKEKKQRWDQHIKDIGTQLRGSGGCGATHYVSWAHTYHASSVCPAGKYMVCMVVAVSISGDSRAA